MTDPKTYYANYASAPAAAIDPAFREVCLFAYHLHTWIGCVFCCCRKSRHRADGREAAASFVSRTAGVQWRLLTWPASDRILSIIKKDLENLLCVFLCFSVAPTFDLSETPFLSVTIRLKEVSSSRLLVCVMFTNERLLNIIKREIAQPSDGTEMPK